MTSKSLLVVLGVLAVVLLVASEVTARDLAETTHGEEKDTKVEKDQYGGGYHGGGGGYPGGGGGYPGGGGGYPGGGGGYPGGGRGYPGHGGYCRYGCCYRGYNGCQRCCSYAGEAIETQVQNKPHN